MSVSVVAGPRNQKTPLNQNFSGVSLFPSTYYTDLGIYWESRGRNLQTTPDRLGARTRGFGARRIAPCCDRVAGESGIP